MYSMNGNDLKKLSKEELIAIIQGKPKRPTRAPSAVPKTLTDAADDLSLDTLFCEQEETTNYKLKKISMEKFHKSELSMGGRRSFHKRNAFLALFF